MSNNIKYLTTKELAELWQISPRGVRKLCPKIEGAEIIEGVWKIPSTAIRPDDKRFRTGNYIGVSQKRQPKIVSRINTGLVNNVLLGDCMIRMREIKSKSVDLILCDLPYEDSGKWDLRMKASDGSVYALENLWKEYLRILKPNGVIALMGTELFTCRLVLSNSKMFKYKIVWGKTRPSGPSNHQPLRYHEDICIFYHTKSVTNKGEVTYNPQKTNLIQRRNSYRTLKDLSQKEWFQDPSGWPTDVVVFDSDKKCGNKNRSRKPVALCEYLIRTYSNEGDTILDNSSGGGSTLVAAIKSLRNFIGIDFNDSFFMNNKETADFIDISKIRICAEWMLLSKKERSLLQESTLFKDFESGSFKNSLTDDQKVELEKIIANRKKDVVLEQKRLEAIENLKKYHNDKSITKNQLVSSKNKTSDKYTKFELDTGLDDINLLYEHIQQLYQGLQPHNPEADYSKFIEQVDKLIHLKK